MVPTILPDEKLLLSIPNLTDLMVMPAGRFSGARLNALHQLFSVVRPPDWQPIWIGVIVEVFVFWLSTTGVPGGSGQLSPTVGKGNVTLAPQRPAAFGEVTVGGQVMEGGVPSVTVTVKEQLEPEALLTLTVVVPTGKIEPEAGVAVMVPHKPVAVTEKFTTAPQIPGWEVVVILAGQVSTQGAPQQEGAVTWKSSILQPCAETLLSEPIRNFNRMG